MSFWPQDNTPVEIIAEAGLNHHGKLHIAFKMVDAAHAAKADIVKFQSYIPESIVHKQDRNYKLLKDLALSRKDFNDIARWCEIQGIEFLTTPGDVDSLKFAVQELGVKRIKIGSDDLTYKPLLEAASLYNLPIILSTGMATIAEVSDAMSIIPHWIHTTLLHCVSLYPCPYEAANLRAMYELRRFGRPVGYSDHVPGYGAVIAAVAMGAWMVEKHFMLNGHTDCVDARVSIDETTLRHMVKQVRNTELMLGHGVKKPGDQERANISIFRKQEDGLRKCVP